MLKKNNETTTYSGDNTDDGTPADHTDADYNDDELLDHDNSDYHESYDGDDGCGNCDGKIKYIWIHYFLFLLLLSVWWCDVYVFSDVKYIQS